MLCAICKIQPLIIKNNNYYCPRCKIYLGKAKETSSTNANPPQTTANQIFPVSYIGSKDQLDPKISAANEAELPKDSPTKNFIIKILKICFPVIIIALIFFKYFIYIDFEKGCYIRISPSWLELSNSSIKNALGVLKRALPRDYDNVCKRVQVIDPNYSCGGFGGGCFSKLKSRTIEVSSFHEDVVFAAMIIVHETCHIQQRDENRSFDEKECYATGYKVFNNLIVY